MVGARCVRDREISAEECRTKFGHELFDRVRFIAEATREIAIEPALVPRPMRELVQERGVIRFGRSAGLGASEALSVRYLNVIARSAVIGAVATVAYVGAGCRRKRLGVVERLDEVPLRRGRWRPAIDLVGVEHPRGAGEESFLALPLARLLVLDLAFELLPKDDDASVLALSDLGLELMPLLVRSPEA
jgi:hypothetical protein